MRARHAGPGPGRRRGRRAPARAARLRHATPRPPRRPPRPPTHEPSGASRRTPSANSAPPRRPLDRPTRWRRRPGRGSRRSTGSTASPPARSLTAEREREAAAGIGGRLERMGIEADAARVGAEMANAACVAARTAVADCDERTRRRPRPRHDCAASPHQTRDPSSPIRPPRRPSASRSRAARHRGSSACSTATSRTPWTTLVASLAGDDPDERPLGGSRSPVSSTRSLPMRSKQAYPAVPA